MKEKCMCCGSDNTHAEYCGNTEVILCPDCEAVVDHAAREIKLQKKATVTKKKIDCKTIRKTIYGE